MWTRNRQFVGSLLHNCCHNTMRLHAAAERLHKRTDDVRLTVSLQKSPPAAEHPQLTCFRPASLLTRVKRGAFSGPSGMNRIHTCLQAREQPATRANASENKNNAADQNKAFFQRRAVRAVEGSRLRVHACVRECVSRRLLMTKADVFFHITPAGLRVRLPPRTAVRNAGTQGRRCSRGAPRWRRELSAPRRGVRWRRSGLDAPPAAAASS